MAIHLGRPLPDASRDRPGRRRGNAPRRRTGAPPLLGLAPGGVYHAASVAGRAVRSYRTLSPLPFAALNRRKAVCSLWHFPWGRPRRTLSGTIFPWSPDFPPHGFPWSGHPAIWRGRTLERDDRRHNQKLHPARRSFATTPRVRGRLRAISNKTYLNTVYAVTAVTVKSPDH